MTREDDRLRTFYDAAAGPYAEMMAAEIEHPRYRETLERLAATIAPLEGPVVDTSVGGGHMLHLLSTLTDDARALIGIDISPEMLERAKALLQDRARLVLGDMRDLSRFDDGSCAGLISYFAIHHLPLEALDALFAEWSRALAPGGRLALGAWEGDGLIEYPGEHDPVAYKHPRAEIERRLSGAGLTLEHVEEAYEDGLEMNTIHVRAIRN